MSYPSPNTSKTQPRPKSYISSAGKFGNISIENILSDVSEIPSSQRRSPSGYGANAGLAKHRSSHHTLNSGSSYDYINSIPGTNITGPIHSLNHNNPNRLRNGASLHATNVASNSPAYRPVQSVRKAIPPRFTQNLPPRTTKVSEKLVLIPESVQPEFKFEDDDSDETTYPPLEDTDQVSQNRKSYAERLPKERRAEKFPRVTAYCISESVRIGAAATFLRENHKIRPRIYNEALYAPYYLPLLPGDDENRVKSSPGGILIMEQMIDHSEQQDHHYEYYSGLEGSKEDNVPDNSSDRHMSSSNSDLLIDMETSPDFDPSEPQDFSPPSNYLEEQMNAIKHTHRNDKLHADTTGLKEEQDKDLKFGNSDDSHHKDAVSNGSSSASVESVLQTDKEFSQGTSFEDSIRKQDRKELDESKSKQDTNQDRDKLLTHSENFESGSQGHDNSSSALESSHSRKDEDLTKTLSADSTLSAFSRHSDTSSGSTIRRSLDAPDTSKHAEIFIFAYGVIVFWNFTEHQEKEILADLTFARVAEVVSSSDILDEEEEEEEENPDAIEDALVPKSLIIRPIPQESIETEELNFTYSPNTVKPRIYNDMITLRSGDHMTKLAMSHALAQSTKLSRFEARMDDNMHDVRHVPKMLALTGRLGLKREELLKISGKLFKLRVDVNLSSNVLDTPDFFWEDEPSLNPLYTAVREYLEIEPRILVLNERCKVFLELTEILADSIAEYNMSRITWIIIILIVLSLAVSMLEIGVRFWIVKDNSKSHHTFKSVD